MNIEKDFEHWVDSLIEEGYDLSDYTWDEIYEEYLSEGGNMTRDEINAYARELKQKQAEARKVKAENNVKRQGDIQGARRAIGTVDKPINIRGASTGVNYGTARGGYVDPSSRRRGLFLKGGTNFNINRVEPVVLGNEKYYPAKKGKDVVFLPTPGRNIQSSTGVTSNIRGSGMTSSGTPSSTSVGSNPPSSGTTPRPRNGGRGGYVSSSDGKTYRNYNDALYARNTRILRPLERTPNTAAGFDTAFAKARELGVKKFKWRGGDYTTKMANEDFEYWVDSLFEEGYDLSNYTWEGLFEYFCENVLSEALSNKSNLVPSSLTHSQPSNQKDFDPKGITGSTLGRTQVEPRDSSLTSDTPPLNRPTPKPDTPAKPATAPPATPKGPTILASRNGVAGTMIKGDPSSWKAKEGGYSSSEMQRIRSVGTKRYETQRKAAVSSGRPEDFKSTTQTGREVWSMANPKLAKANADRELTRGTIMTSNPAARSLIKPPEGVLTNGPEVPKTGLDPSTGYGPPPPPPVPGGPSAPAPAPAPAPAASTKIRSGTRSLSAADQRELLGQRRPQTASRTSGTLNASFDFSSPSKVASDMAYLYQSIYEGKKKVDQDMDGDNDFADVMIARMVAAGVPRAEAIRRVRNKEYNV